MYGGGGVISTWYISTGGCIYGAGGEHVIST